MAQDYKDENTGYPRTVQMFKSEGGHHTPHKNQSH